jgi:nicotinamidase-related amidase
MTRLVFWDVDTQWDLMHPEGKLYVPDGESIIPTLQALTDFAHAHRTPIVASAGSHLPDDAELADAPDWSATFPPHCMRGTPGEARIAQTALTDPLVIEPELQDPGALAHRILGHRGDFLLIKRTLDVFGNANVPTLLRALEPESIVVYGVATDLAVKHTVEGLLRHWPRAELLLVTDAVRSFSSEEADRLLSSWRERGIHLVGAAELLSRPEMEGGIGQRV